MVKNNDGYDAKKLDEINRAYDSCANFGDAKGFIQVYKSSDVMPSQNSISGLTNELLYYKRAVTFPRRLDSDMQGILEMSKTPELFPKLSENIQATVDYFCATGRIDEGKFLQSQIKNWAISNPELKESSIQIGYETLLKQYVLRGFDEKMDERFAYVLARDDVRLGKEKLNCLTGRIVLDSDNSSTKERSSRSGLEYLFNIQERAKETGITPAVDVNLSELVYSAAFRYCGSGSVSSYELRAIANITGLRPDVDSGRDSLITTQNIQNMYWSLLAEGNLSEINNLRDLLGVNLTDEQSKKYKRVEKLDSACRYFTKSAMNLCPSDRLATKLDNKVRRLYKNMSDLICALE